MGLYLHRTGVQIDLTNMFLHLTRLKAPNQFGPNHSGLRKPKFRFQKSQIRPHSYFFAKTCFLRKSNRTDASRMCFLGSLHGIVKKNYREGPRLNSFYTVRWIFPNSVPIIILSQNLCFRKIQPYGCVQNVFFRVPMRNRKKKLPGRASF